MINLSLSYPSLAYSLNTLMYTNLFPPLYFYFSCSVQYMLVSLYVTISFLHVIMFSHEMIAF